MRYRVKKALTGELQVSVMTLRKALTLLESEKLIVKRHGSGSRVALEQLSRRGT